MNIIFTIGISGAGKSTWARTFINSNSNYVRINRDTIRECLVPNHKEIWYNRKDRKELERLVTGIEYSIVDETFAYKKNVLIDATNLNKQHLLNFVGMIQNLYYGTTISYKIFECPLDVAQTRIKERDSVNADYIKQQHENFIETVNWLKTTQYKEI